MSDFPPDDDHPGPRPPRQVNPRGASGRAHGRGSTYAGRSGQTPPERGRASERSYNVYRSTPRSLGARLRGESDVDLGAQAEELSRRQPARPPRREGLLGDLPGGRGGGGGGRPPRRGLRRIPGLGPALRPLWHPLRLLKYAVLLCIFWVVLSGVLFFMSASGGNLPGGSATRAALTGAGPMLFTPNNILVVGLDVRPRTGYSSHEAGANYNERVAATDTLMIWRVGGGVSRKLSVPRDTLVNIPGCGMAKINAAWACGGPAATIHVVESLTGVKINHMIVVSLGNFIKFIDDIGGVTVRTPRICSNISHGTYVLNLAPGVHHLTGVQAITLARTRDNSCNIAYNDFNREKEQQQIMSGIKSQLFSLHAFLHLPWAASDAPKAIQTDMGPLTLLQLFGAAEIGGSSKPVTLGGGFGTYNGQDVVINNRAETQRLVQHLLNG